jgi:hypothetical protein
VSPKRHHWWPICHSRLWTDEHGCITTTNASGETRRTQPVNTAVIGHYNSVRRPDGTRDPALEEFFATEIEAHAAPVLARLATERRRDLAAEAHFDHGFLRREWKNLKRDGYVPSTQAFTAALGHADRSSLARYVASLLVRVPSYKDELNSKRMIENVAGLLGIDADAARFATDTLHVEIIRKHLDDYGERLTRCEFTLIDTAADEFVIGDTPVIPAALGFGEAEAMMPLTPTRALLMIRGWRPPLPDRAMIFASQPNSVRAFNKTMVQNAEREVFSRGPVNADFVRRNLGTRQVRLQPDTGTAAGEHVARGPLLDRNGTPP